MKVIGRAGGLVACREAQEEYMPDRPPPVRDVIDLVRDTYQFVSFPILQQGFNPNSPYVFSVGRFAHGDQAFGITQLVMLPIGDVIGTASTDDSELVLDDLMRLLDENLGFKLRQANPKRSYMSTIVVDFDNAFSSYMEKINEMEKCINSVLIPGNDARWFKGISFGREEGIFEPQGVTEYISLVEKADFTIERRAGQPFSGNRFYCTAPMRTADHIRVLEQIETIMRG
jgi:hypothetical protein